MNYRELRSLPESGKRVTHFGNLKTLTRTHGFHKFHVSIGILFVKIFMIIITFLFLASMTYAVEKTVEWDPVISADGYRVSISSDLGETWAQVSEVLAPVVIAVIDVPENQLILIRASAYNNISEEVNTYSGVWFNSTWRKISPPTEIRTQGQ